MSLSLDFQASHRYASTDGIDVPIEPRLGEMVQTEGASSRRGPDDHAQPRRIIGRGLGAEEL